MYAPAPDGNFSTREFFHSDRKPFRFPLPGQKTLIRRLFLEGVRPWLKGVTGVVRVAEEAEGCSNAFLGTLFEIGPLLEQLEQ